MANYDQDDYASIGEKRRRRILKTIEEPVLPKLCKILFGCMAVVTGAVVLADIVSFIRFGAHLGAAHLLSNAALSGFFCWLIFSAALIPLSAVCVLKARRAASKEGVPVDRPYIRYIRVSAIGLLAFGIFFLLSR